MCVQNKASALSESLSPEESTLRISQFPQLCLLPLRSDTEGWDEGDKSRATPEKDKALMPSLFCQDLQLGTLAQEPTIPTLGSTSGLTAAKMGSWLRPGEQGVNSS